MKDNFSIQSHHYVKFRPCYPIGLYSFLLSLVKDKQAAWDCGTGNGQIARELSGFFNRVYATDISKAQLDNAFKADNIFYKRECAETTDFPDSIFDLITVGQAIHWFDFDSFYTEVRRTLKPEGILAVIGYGLMTADTNTNEIINRLHHDIVGPYWDEERKYIDEEYQTIPFPFKEIKAPVFKNEFDWTFEQLIGYLNTWSAVQHYIRSNGQNPIDLVYEDLQESWQYNPNKTVVFPILLKVGATL